MTNIYIGLICLGCSLFLIFYSPKEKGNMLGYKSLQLNTHKDIWKWTNICFGLLTLIGSIVYLSLSILEALKIINFANLNKYGLYYIGIAFAVTEFYAFYKKIKYRNQ